LIKYINYSIFITIISLKRAALTRTVNKLLKANEYIKYQH